MENGLTIAPRDPEYLISFYGENVKFLGGLKEKDGALHFEGDVTESGKIFVDWVLKVINEQLKK